MALQTLTVSAAIEKIENDTLTIAGVKTFSSSPIVPAPTTDLQAATKKYVDDNEFAQGDITGIFGTWADKSTSYGAQQATTDGFVLAYTAIGCESKYLSGYTDAATDPTTRVAYFDLRGAYNAGRGNMNIMFPVKKNHYWKVTTDATISKVYWLPLGA